MSDDRQNPRRQSLRPSASGQGGATRPTRASTGVQRTTSQSAPVKQSASGKGGDKPPKAAWKVWTKRIGIGIVVTGFVSVLVVLIGLFIAYQRIEIPEADSFALYEQSTIYYDDGTTVMGTLGSAEREILTMEQYQELPEYVPNAIVAAEDRTFWENRGVDLTGTVRALYKTIVQGDRQGGSTISQQYVERYYSGDTVTDIPGKIKEALLALKINNEQSKDEILLNYMNTIYLGRGAYGIEKAAEEYFGKDAKDLTVSEAALIAGIIPAPSAWDPRFDEVQAEFRWNYVLDGMVDGGVITQDERDAQVFPQAIPFEQGNVYAGTNGYLVRTALDEVIANTELTQEDIETLGLSIVTTIKKSHQDATVAAVQAMPEDHSENLRTAAVTVDSATGAITSMYGGPDYVTIPRNAVTQDVAQAGSTFKPFALIAGLEQGIGLGTQYLANNNMTIEGYENPVRNFGGVNYGVIDLVKATQNSVNTAFVQLAIDVGPENVMQAAIDAGIPDTTTDLNANPSVVLGAAAPHPIDMAEAYATISSGGVHNDTYIVQTVRDRTGETTYEHDGTSRRVFEEDVIADTTYAMQQVVLYGSGKTASSLGRPLAGKTGTSNDNKSAWFVAFTPQIVGAVALYQVGEDYSVEQITPFGGYSEITGSTVPTDVWTAMMGPILSEYEVQQFPARANVGTDTKLEPTASPTPTRTPTQTTEAPEPVPTETTAEPEPSVTPTPEPTASPAPTVTPTVEVTANP